VKRYLLAPLLAALVMPTGMARADDRDKAAEPAPLFEVGLDYQLGSYGADPTIVDGDARTNATYAVSMHLLAPDADKATPLRSIPVIWLAMQLGWMGASTTSEPGTEDGGGFLLDFQVAGPWTLVHRPRFRAYLGVGFNFGIELGHPGIVERSALAADAFAMGIVDVDFDKFTLTLEGEYATGVEYNEQRALALLRVGKLGLGATVVAGQSGIDYHRIGAHVGYAF
jgi:hypothetical protein